MNWLTYLAAPICLLLGMLISLFVKERARDTAHEEFAALIVAALSKFRLELITSLDATYRRVGECNLMMEPADDRIEILTKRVDVHDAKFEVLKAERHRRSGEETNAPMR